MSLAASLPQIRSDLLSDSSISLRKREIAATFYVLYSTFSVVVRFLNICIAAVWQSLNDFPKARRLLGKFAGNKT